MIQNRWMIPAGFGAACVVLAVCGVALEKKGVVHKGEKGLTAGQSHVWQGLALDAGKRYTLQMRPTSGVPINSQSVVSATLMSGDNVVFELEDAYWHERGRWSEGGESGTWEEQNTSSEFSFLVPEDGKYDLEFGLVSATSIAGDRLDVQLLWRKPWLLTPFPLGIGAVLLFGVAGWAYSGRRKAMGKFLQTMDVGTRLVIEEVEYTVIARMEHWEGRDRVGVEFRMRSADGRERWLAIEEFWREHPYIEDGDQTLVQTLIDVPLTPQDQQRLDQQGSHDSHALVGAEAYGRDQENGGHGTLVTTRDGEVYRSRYNVQVFRDMVSFPMSPGDVWVECLTWHDTREIEWSVMQLVDTDTIKILELVTTEGVTADEATSTQSSDPFGVAQMRGKRPDVQRTGQAAPQQQQQQQHQQQQSPFDPPDWN